MRDEEIVELYWQRNEDAIRETSRKYETYLLKIANNILGNMEDSRECVNDTYLAAWNTMPEHRPGVLSAYLAKITRNLSIDIFRKRRCIKRCASEYVLSISELEDCVPGGETPEQVFDAKQLDDAINTFARMLPDKARDIFIGRYYFFDSVKAIAAYCGISESNTRIILCRTRKKLKEYLLKEGFML